MSLPTALHLICWNVRKGEHLGAALAWLADQDLDIVLWQELQPGQLDVVADRLQMAGFPAAETTTPSTNHNAIFVRDVERGGVFSVEAHYQHAWAPWHPPANITVRLHSGGGEPCPRPLHLASEHSCYFSAAKRLEEVDWYTTLNKEDQATGLPWLCIVGGDWNSYPEGETPDGLDDPQAVADRPFATNRTYLEEGRRIPDDRPDRTLIAAGYVDAARFAHDELGQGKALDGTAGYGPEKARQGGAVSRIDRVYLSRELAPAVTRVRVVAGMKIRRISDHPPVCVDLNPRVFAEVMQRRPAAESAESAVSHQHSLH